MVGACWVNAVLVANHLPELGPDLVAAAKDGLSEVPNDDTDDLPLAGLTVS